MAVPLESAVSLGGQGDRPAGWQWILGLLVLAAVATPAYWVIWYFGNRDWLATDHSAAYYAFENAFPLADGWLTLASALGAGLLLRRRPMALFWMLCAGSAGVYLACMDLLFDLENGIFTHRGPELGNVITEGLIITLTAVGGIAVLVFAWRRRHLLAPPEA